MRSAADTQRNYRNFARLLGDVDVLAVDHLEDGGLAGAVAHVVHGDLAGHAREVFHCAEALTDFVQPVKWSDSGWCC